MLLGEVSGSFRHAILWIVSHLANVHLPDMAHLAVHFNKFFERLGVAVQGALEDAGSKGEEERLVVPSGAFVHLFECEGWSVLGRVTVISELMWSRPRLALVRLEEVDVFLRHTEVTAPHDHDIQIPLLGWLVLAG